MSTRLVEPNTAMSPDGSSLMQYTTWSSVNRRTHKLVIARCIIVTLIMLVGALPITVKAEPYERRVALLIGLGEYESGQGKGFFRNLPAANDLEAIAEALQYLKFDEITIYSDVKQPIGSRWSYLPLGSGSSLGRVGAGDIGDLIQRRLASLDSVHSRSLLFIYFSGHGGIIGDEERVLAAPNSQRDLPDSFYSVSRILEKMYNNARSVDKVLVIDACADPINPELKGETYPSKRDELMPTYYFSSKVKEPSFMDLDRRVSVFTYYFVQALTRAKELQLLDSEGYIEPEELRRYLVREVPLHTKIEPKRVSIGKVQVARKPQNPSISGRLDIVLGQDPAVALDARNFNSNFSSADRERYVQGLGKIYYPGLK